jgi:translation initiation factor 3 subunit L
MSLRERAPAYDAPIRTDTNESDVEEEALVNSYRESVQYDGMEELGRVPSIASNQDIQAQLQAAATPLEFQATLETKFASYDSYCNLFHYILNSEGPVDLEVPNVSFSSRGDRAFANEEVVFLGLGCHRRVHLSIQ